MGGATLIDLFAAATLIGELASQTLPESGECRWDYGSEDELARHCYNMAFSMLEARQRP